MGGQGAPGLVSAATAEYFMGANWALFSYASMGNGTADMIHKYGTEEQKKMYVERLVSGEWGGTMLLTEANAGSDVGALTTSAVKNEDGTYTLTGNKIFITNGEHDLCENIIHPVLARIEGDPAGTKGISIFIVPKFFVNPDGSLGEHNDIVCTGGEWKPSRMDALRQSIWMMPLLVACSTLEKVWLMLKGMVYTCQCRLAVHHLG